MKEVYYNLDSTKVGLYKSVLEEAGIACFVRNEDSSLIVRIPSRVYDRALCVVNDADYDQAKAIVDAYRLPVSTTGGDWTCPQCQSVVPAAFDACWKCEHARPATPG